MESDRKLLELAAKAAGYEFIYFPPYPNGMQGEYLRVRGMENRWNPLENDGDALRLAVKLGMSLDTALGQSLAITPVFGGRDCVESHATDPYAGTRRAIVRAAAEIGKSLG